MAKVEEVAILTEDYLEALEAEHRAIQKWLFSKKSQEYANLVDVMSKYDDVETEKTKAEIK